MKLLLTTRTQAEQRPPNKSAPRDWSATDPLDTPCLPAVNPLWPGMPRWVELESTRVDAMEAAGWVDEDPPSPEQARYIRHLGGQPPLSREEAGRLITMLKRAKQRAV